jgi:hypothetical protein
LVLMLMSQVTVAMRSFFLLFQASSLEEKCSFQGTRRSTRGEEIRFWVMREEERDTLLLKDLMMEWEEWDWTTVRKRLWQFDNIKEAVVSKSCHEKEKKEMLRDKRLENRDWTFLATSRFLEFSRSLCCLWIKWTTSMNCPSLY